jgi:hypothetical protein
VLQPLAFKSRRVCTKTKALAFKFKVKLESWEREGSPSEEVDGVAREIIRQGSKTA